jgi:hypothetical protein
MIKRSIFLILSALVVFSCNNSEETLDQLPVINPLPLTTEMRENPQAEEVIGTIPATTTLGSITYKLVSQTPDNAMAVEPTRGLLTVNDPALFDFETYPTIEAVYEASVGDVKKQGTITVLLTDRPDFTIWRGEIVTFSKSDGSDPGAEANQDRISDNIWITRGNDGGQIYNAASETSANKTASPAGTEWAFGLVEEIEGLDFRPFREAVGKPNNVVGKDLVLHLIEDDVYMQVKFTSWSQGKKGGFSYERSGSPD